MPKAIAVFTYRSVERIKREAGSAAWKLNRGVARDYEYVVCMRNRNNPLSEGDEPHGTAFMVGKISDIVSAPERPERWLIKFSEYSLIEIHNLWSGRNPVHYTSLEELGIDPKELEFHTMPEADEIEHTPLDDHAVIPDDISVGLTIAEAKRGLAVTFGVAEDAVEITIRG